MASYKQVQKLIQASLKGDVSTIEEILSSKKVDVNCKNTHEQFPLLVASQNGHKEAVKLLIERGAHVNMESRNKVTSLLLASECGHHETVQILLENGAHIDHGVSDGRTPLMLASENGHEETVSVLLSKNADVNLYATGKETALTFALKAKHPEVAKLLLPHTADIDSRDSTGVTPLMKASFYGLVDVTKSLLIKGARVNLRTCTGSTALMLVSRTGNSEIALTLLKHGADVDLQKDDGCTALIIASQEGRKDVVKVLLSHNAEVDLRLRSSGKTALIIASENGHAEIVKYLLCDGAADNEDPLEVVSEENVEITENQGQLTEKTTQHARSPSANVNIVDNQGQTALSVASSRGDFEIVETLVHHGADVNRSKGEKSALSRAVRCQSAKVVEVLLENKASAVEADLVYASIRGDLELVKLLLPHISNTTSLALWWAIRCGHTHIVSFLLESGVSVNDNMMSSKLQLPGLVIATIREDVEIVEALLNKGAKVDVTCGRNQNVTPLMLAIFAGHKDLVKILAEHGADVYCTFVSSEFTCMHLANAVGNQKIIAIVKEHSHIDQSKAESDFESKIRLRKATMPIYVSYATILEKVERAYTYYRALAFYSDDKEQQHQQRVVEQKLLDLFPENADNDMSDEECQKDVSDQPQLSMCVPPTISDVYAVLLPLPSKWKNIGVLLKIDYNKLQTIEADKKDSQSALLDMVVEWLRRIDSPQPTWSELVEAVKLFEPTIAQKIQEKHCT